MTGRIFIILLLFVIVLPGMAAAATQVSPAPTGCPGGVCPDYPGNPTGVRVPAPFSFLLLFGPAGAPTATFVILGIISILLAVAGFLAVLMLVIGGVRYIVAHGNEEQAEGAKKNITHAVIGLAIVILAFVVVRVISNALILGKFGA